MLFNISIRQPIIKEGRSKFSKKCSISSFADRWGSEYSATNFLLSALVLPRKLGLGLLSPLLRVVTPPPTIVATARLLGAAFFPASDHSLAVNFSASIIDTLSASHHGISEYIDGLTYFSNTRGRGVLFPCVACRKVKKGGEKQKSRSAEAKNESVVGLHSFSAAAAAAAPPAPRSGHQYLYPPYH